MRPSDLLHRFVRFCRPLYTAGHRTAYRATLGHQVGVGSVWLLIAAAANNTLAAPACPPLAEMPSTAQAQALARTAPDRGFLFRLRRDGHDSYLYGSLHIGRMAWVFPGPRLREAMQESDTLALELDISDPATLQALAQGPAHARPYTPSAKLQQRLARQTRLACLPETALSHLHPLLQLSNLMALDSRWDRLDPSYGQEMMLAGWAQQTGHPIVALESVDTQLQALIPDDPKTAETQLQSGLQQLEQGVLRRSTARLATAWADSDFPTLAAYESWCHCIFNAQDRAELRALNDDRNPGLAEHIAALHQQGHHVLAAVGSLHLTGPQALTLLLERHGFEVQPIHPTYHPAYHAADSAADRNPARSASSTSARISNTGSPLDPP
ncbi:TraB/GumN family protein [Roseateles koreensis]|uniref:TraB/GumN family protein n=1 Tax=Roseateles koreensis TaxID=2987526 RepID=A0ABT5KPX5_9BURK|nr:TraB/GumN family protein [Roseateles koreensis]MDC8784917.1 TraB/GumN family protein [Roseateles koreensis]